MRKLTAIAAVALVSVALSGCDFASWAGGRSAKAERGAEIITQTGCGTCHTIPGIDGANGLVGPPLTHMANRVYIAGVLRNTQDNLTRWILDPQSVVPGNAMPNMGLSEKQASSVVAYIATLK